MGNGATDCGWRHAPEPRGGFEGFWKSQLVKSCRPKKKGDFRLLAKALGRCHTKYGGGGAQMEKPE